MSTKSAQKGSGAKDIITKGPKIIKIQPRVVAYREAQRIIACKKMEGSHAKAGKTTGRRTKTQPSKAHKRGAKNNPNKAADRRKVRKADKQ